MGGRELEAILTQSTPFTDKEIQIQRGEGSSCELVLAAASGRQLFGILNWDFAYYTVGWAPQVALVVKNPRANAGRRKRRGFNSWVGKISWRTVWQPTPVFLPGESHGQRSVVGCSPWIAESWTQLK